MKALLLSDVGRLEVVDVPQPQIERDSVLVRVAACGICGSDVHGYDGSSGRRIPPLIMGHEAAGIVTGVGSGVTRFAEGDRVTFDSTVYCGSCDYCQKGAVNLCQERQVLGVSCADYRRHGAFAEFVAVPERIVYHLPEQVTLEHAALLEAVGVAVHAAQLPGDEALRGPCLVIGSGMIGILICQALRALGAEEIVVVDRDASRLALVERVAAVETLLATDEQDTLARLRECLDGRDLHASWEAVGVSSTVQLAVESVRKQGHVVLVGNVAPSVDLPLQTVVTRELKICGSCASAGEYPLAMEWLAQGVIDVSPLVTAVAPLEEGAEWFARLHQREAGLMKVVLQP